MVANEELPWTTSRCNRLLRPISSKLTKLRIELERPRSAGIESRVASTACATKSSPCKTTNFTRPVQKPRGFEKARDPDWRPDAKAGRGNKKTYGGRGARKVAALQRSAVPGNRASRPGEIAFTPLVARIGNQLLSSPHIQHSPLKKYGKTRGPLQVNVDWTQLPGDLRKLVQGAAEAYANLLQATTEGQEKSWRGTRSLLGACLRRLPAYIELEEHFAKLDREEEDDDSERDVSAEIYGHLEDSFEQRPGHGWRPFKQVLRAHATSLLCDAITDEIISLDSMSMIITHCVRVSAWDEAERLLMAYLPLLEPLSIPANVKVDLFDAQRAPYLFAFKSFVDHTGRHRLLFDLLEHMVAHELLPLEWLATECMRPVWDRLVRSTTSNDHRTFAHTYQFLETVIIAGMGLPDERLLADETTGTRRFVPSSREDLRSALNTTYSSLLTVMCSITLVNNTRDDEVGRSITRRVSWMLDAIVVATLSRNDIRSEFQLLQAHADDGQTFLQRAVWVVFASILVHLDNHHAESSTVSLELDGLIRGVSWLASQYLANGINMAPILGSLPAVISSVARGTGRIWKDDGFDQLQRLVQALMSLSGHRLPHKLWTLKRLALDSATEFAQDTGMIEHLTYARDIEQKMRTQGQLVIVPSPQKNGSPSTGGGFRWEEGIGEWVACTPFAKQGVRRVFRKPVPSLELLPTPAQSEDEDALAYSGCKIGLTSDINVFDDEDAIPQSSPIKRAPRTSICSLGKRQRASSPMVVVPIKRTRTTPPDTPIKFYPVPPSEKTEEVEEVEEDDGPRRSRRSRKEIQILASRLKTQRSRTSLESGLRTQGRKTYAEPNEVDDWTSEETDSVSESQDASVASSDTDTSPPHTREQTRPTRGRPPRMSAHCKISYDNAEERDVLSITPARPTTRRRKSSRNVVQRNKQLSRFGRAVIGDSDDDESEDELSFH
jgi:hypothetical protein